MSRLMLLFMIGGCGTLARYWLGGIVQRMHGGQLLYGTFVVNALGCLLFGLVWSLAEERVIISGETRFIVLTGFMGAFTTFSTYAFETTAFLRDREYLYAAGNLLAHSVVGIVAILLGIALGRLF